MKRNGNLGLLATSLLAAAISAPGAAAESGAEPELELEPVVVTGSHIPRIPTEGPSPVTTITAEDFGKRGLTTVDEIINSLTQFTGATQNETMSRAGAFTQNANAVDLRGLGPGRTLILVDGRRQADYPLPYNGESNFVNLSAIPVAAIERIDLLASGASAIYGSDAVAGVINIVLKKKLDQPFNLDLRFGDTTQGGGKSARAQLVTGFELGKLNTLFAAELFDRKPVYAFQRGFQDSVLDNPDPGARIPSRAILWYDAFYDSYVDPGQSACDAFPNLPYTFRDTYGYYCGQADALAQFTLQNARSRGSLFGRATYELGTSELFGTVRLHGSRDRYDPANTFFTSEWLLPETYFFDVSSDPNGDGGVYSSMQRYFQPYETGGYRARQYRDRERVIDLAVGIRGAMTQDWRYDLTLSSSRYHFREHAPQLLTQALIDYYLGPQLEDGSGNLLWDPEYDYYPVYDVDWSRLYQPLTPETYNSLLGINRTRADSDSRTATLVLNGALFDAPAGPVDAAVVLEAARQSYGIDLDPRLLAGEFACCTGTGGGGKRKRYAAGLELGVPVADPVRLQLAGRYDRYDDVTNVKGALTYNLGIEYRPINQLLLRASHASSFRAPDMHFVFADPSGYYTNVTDEYLCRRDEPGSTLGECSIESGSGLFGTTRGNPQLREEKGRSLTFGFVAQPLRDLSITADYYHIRIKDAVQDYSIRKLLRTEADCRLGTTRGGEPVDIDSAECQWTLAQIQRLPEDDLSDPEYLDSVSTTPTNQAMRRTSGIDLSLHYAWTAGAAGRFDFDLRHSKVLTDKTREFEGDAVENSLKDMQNWDWQSRISGEVTWTLGEVTSTLFVQRFGSIPNWAETARIGSWTLANLSARYRGLMDDKVYVGFAVNNLFNRKPRRDATYDSYPYYSDFNYDPIGREVFLEIGTSF